MSKVVRFVTLGCKVNQYETNAMAQKFLENGYEISVPMFVNIGDVLKSDTRTCEYMERV